VPSRARRFGSLSPNRPRRRRFYLAYFIGFAIAAGLLEVAAVFSFDRVRGDPDIYWQVPLFSVIVNPALILLSRIIHKPPSASGLLVV
jgi:hypothetical protein